MKRRSSRQDFRPGAPLGKVDQSALYVNTLQVFFRLLAEEAPTLCTAERPEMAGARTV